MLGDLTNPLGGRPFESPAVWSTNRAISVKMEERGAVLAGKCFVEIQMGTGIKAFSVFFVWPGKRTPTGPVLV
jgi:hypothetical protein